MTLLNLFENFLLKFQVLLILGHQNVFHIKLYHCKEVAHIHKNIKLSRDKDELQLSIFDKILSGDPNDV